jgi:hypothetical protein
VQPQMPRLPQNVQATVLEREPYEHERDLHAEHAAYDRANSGPELFALYPES